MVQSIAGQQVAANPYAYNNGLTTKAYNPNEAVSFSGVKDVFIRKPAKNDPNQAMTPSMQAEQAEKAEKSNKRARFLGVAILLIGGAILGYGHRKPIENAINNLKGKFAEFAAKPKVAEYIAKGQELIAKAKDAIFVKPPTV